MRIRPNRSLMRAGVHALGEAAIRVPLAGRIVAQLLDPATPPWRRAMLLVVAADAVIGMIETVHQPATVRPVRSSS